VEQLFFVVITLILLLTLIVLVAFSIPTILQIRRTAKSVEDLLKSTEGALNSLLLELKESIERINRTTEGIEGSVKNVQYLTKSIGEIGALLDEVNNLVRQTGSSFAVKTACIGVGIKTALGVLAKGLIKKASSKEKDA